MWSVLFAYSHGCVTCPTDDAEEAFALMRRLVKTLDKGTVTVMNDKHEQVVKIGAGGEW